MELDEATKIVKEFVRPWSDQKLVEVLAFAEAGKMQAWNSRCCILGVGLVSPLWNGIYFGADAEKAYFLMKMDIHNCLVERAYYRLGYSKNIATPANLADSQPERDQYFIAILQEVITERAFEEQSSAELPELVTA